MQNYYNKSNQILRLLIIKLIYNTTELINVFIFCINVFFSRLRQRLYLHVDVPGRWWSALMVQTVELM